VAQSINNIVIPGPAVVYIAPHSTSALQAAPAATILKGSEWAGTWVEAGYTKGGVQLQTSVEALNVEVDQVNAPVTDFITSQKATISFACTEATLANMRQALGFGTITTGSTESKLGVSAADGIQTYYTIGFEQFAPAASASSARYRRIIGWKARPTGEVELKADKTEEQAIAFTFELRWEPQAAASERLFAMIDRVV